MKLIINKKPKFMDELIDKLTDLSETLIEVKDNYDKEILPTALEEYETTHHKALNDASFFLSQSSKTLGLVLANLAKISK